VWDPVTGQAHHTLTGHTGAVEALVVAPDGSWLASASTDGTVRIWDLAVARCSMSLRTGHRLGQLAAADECIAAAGDCGPYFWVKTQPLHKQTAH
jgi:WD40 repeat protein